MIDLKGKRTKITGWVMALMPVLGLVITGFDQEAFMTMFNQGFEAIITLYTILGALVHYYRGKAGES